jgi:hypothetical protein
MQRLLSAWSASVLLTVASASAQPVLLFEFNPGLGQLAGSAFDHTSDLVWTYNSSGTVLSSYTRAGAFVAAIPRPGEGSNDFDLDVSFEAFSLNGVSLPAGTLLVINGEVGPAEVYAVDKTNGTVLATLATAFGASHVVGGAWHNQRGTLFLVADQNDVNPNTIAEINPATGAVVSGPFSPGADFTVNFGDLSISAATGNLVLISNAETFVRVLTPTGALVEDIPLPTGPAGMPSAVSSGIGIDEQREEVWISGTDGVLYRLGPDVGPTTTSTTLVSTTSTSLATTTSVPGSTTTTIVGTSTSTTTIGSSTSTTVIGTTVTSTSSSTTTTTTPPPSSCQLLTGKKLLLKAKAGSAKRGINLLSDDSTITLGDGNGSADDPVIEGGSLRVVSTAGDGFDDTYPLDASRWSYKKKEGDNAGYKFRPTSPIKSVLVQPGKRIKIVANGTGLGHTLGADPQPVDVVLTLGGQCYCMRFGGAVTFKADKKWLAKDASAPTVCGAPAVE